MIQLCRHTWIESATGPPSSGEIERHRATAPTRRSRPGLPATTSARDGAGSSAGSSGAGAAAWLARTPAGWRAAGDELCLEAVEEGLEAELEAVFGCGGVLGGGRVDAEAQSWEPGRHLSGSGHALAQQRFGITAAAAELPRDRRRRGGAEGIAEHEREDGGRRLVGARAGEAGRLVEGDAVVVVAGLAGAVDHERAEGP